MLDREEVIRFYTELKKKVVSIKDPKERKKAILDGLNTYTLDEWCEIGDILISEKLI